MAKGNIMQNAGRDENCPYCKGTTSHTRNQRKACAAKSSGAGRNKKGGKKNK